MDHLDASTAEAMGRAWRTIAMEAPVYVIGEERKPLPPGCAHHLPMVGWDAIMTRETGYFLNGLSKEPAFDSCFHLSLAFHTPDHAGPKTWAFNEPLALSILRGAFGDEVPYVWTTQAVSGQGKARDVRHFYLFVDPMNWSTPIQRMSDRVSKIGRMGQRSGLILPGGTH